MSCAKCGSEDVIIIRRYSGQSLCKKCFIKTTQKKVLRDIKKYKLIEKGDKVIVAFSGGKDSTMALDILSILADQGIIELEALSIDEGIKGYREKSLKIASKTCQEMGIPHHKASFKGYFGMTLDEIMSSNPPRNACTYCGVFRRWILNIEAEKVEADKIATGHNLDDETQAILMNYLEGNIRNLIKIGAKTSSKKLVTKIKPLREIPEREVTLYVKARRLNVYLPECPYRRTSFRRRIGVFLEELSENHPTIMYSTLRGFDKIKKALQRGSRNESMLGECENCGQPAAGKLCRVCTFLDELKGSVKS